jgi:hypothetical protein
MRRIAVAFLCLPALAGCGGGSPSIDSAVADKLANQADAIAQKAAAGDPCAARNHARILQRQTIAAINAGTIPASYQETLQARVNEIDAALEPRCLPSLSPAPQSSYQPDAGRSEPSPKPKEHEHEHEHDKKPKPKKEHGHGKGKKD